MIEFYDSHDNKLGTTTKKISGAMVTEELEREWTANIELPLRHPCAGFVTEENSVRIDGQMYDIVAITEYTGEQNSISFECEHRSYRLNDVTVEAFTNLGTAADTLGKLLEDTSFTVGAVPSTDVEAFFNCGSRYDSQCNLSVGLCPWLGSEMGQQRGQSGRPSWSRPR